MKANELMIGDWVQLKTYGVSDKFERTEAYMYVKVAEIHSGFIITEGNNNIKEPYCICENTKIEPIPLTPEILEKNGFKEYDGFYRLDIVEGVFVNADFKSKEPFVSVHNTCYRATPICRYLHQLQHVLRLCGIEKEIEL
jgi:hypothetical protein